MCLCVCVYVFMCVCVCVRACVKGSVFMYLRIQLVSFALYECASECFCSLYFIKKKNNYNYSVLLFVCSVECLWASVCGSTRLSKTRCGWGELCFTSIVQQWHLKIILSLTYWVCLKYITYIFCVFLFLFVLLFWCYCFVVFVLGFGFSVDEQRG